MPGLVLNFALHPDHALACNPRQNICNVNRAPMQHAPIFLTALYGTLSLDSREHLRSDSPRRDLPAYVLRTGHKMARERRHQNAILRLAQRHEFLGILQSHRDRFIDNRRNPPLKRQLAGREMYLIGRAHKNAINQIRIEHIAVIRKYLALTQPLIAIIQTFPGNIANRRNLHIRPLEQIRDMIARTKRTEANNTNFYLLHINPFPSSTSHPHRGRVRASGW